MFARALDLLLSEHQPAVYGNSAKSLEAGIPVRGDDCLGAALRQTLLSLQIGEAGLSSA